MRSQSWSGATWSLSEGRRAPSRRSHRCCASCQGISPPPCSSRFTSQPRSGADWLQSIFAKNCRLPIETPAGEQPLEPGRVYVARPDHHLVVKEGRVLANRGPRENLWRPAIDVLFRSAAVAYDSRVVGVLMSGELDDGTSGLQAISACGGVTVVQNPDDAQHPAMLQTALANVRVDHCPSCASCRFTRAARERAGRAGRRRSGAAPQGSPDDRSAAGRSGADAGTRRARAALLS